MYLRCELLCNLWWWPLNSLRSWLVCKLVWNPSWFHGLPSYTGLSLLNCLLGGWFSYLISYNWSVLLQQLSPMWRQLSVFWELASKFSAALLKEFDGYHSGHRGFILVWDKALRLVPKNYEYMSSMPKCSKRLTPGGMQAKVLLIERVWGRRNRSFGRRHGSPYIATGARLHAEE
jgi:hypothetical protein